MKITIDLNEEMVKEYARHLGYSEESISNIDKNDFFIEGLSSMIEDNIDMVL